MIRIWNKWSSNCMCCREMKETLPGAARCCSVLQCVAVWRSVLQGAQEMTVTLSGLVLNRVVVKCCSMMQHAAVCCSALQRVTSRNSLSGRWRWRARVAQCGVVCCNVLRCVAVCCVCCVVLQCVATCWLVSQCVVSRQTDAGVLFIWTTHCNTLQHTATHCNTLQHTATHCNTCIPRGLVSWSIWCVTLQHTGAYCNTLQYTATRIPIWTYPGSCLYEHIPIWTYTYMNISLSDTCDWIQHLYVRHDLLIHTQWRLRALLKWIYDLLTCVPWYMHMCDMTQWQDCASICYMCTLFV